MQSDKKRIHFKIGDTLSIAGFGVNKQDFNYKVAEKDTPVFSGSDDVIAKARVERKKEEGKRIQLELKECKSEDCYIIGFMHEYTNKKPKIAFEFFKKACNDNYGSSCFSVGMSYQLGKEVAKNHNLEEKYYQKACKLGVKEACGKLGYSSSRALLGGMHTFKIND